jgi:penicillin amidase
LLLGAILVIAALLLVQRWGASDRRERESFALASGTIRISELTAPVEILRDSRGIPHLAAAGENEAWFGLGFVHAQDRLGQMAWLRRRAYGRTAEIEGASALQADRLARLLEIERASEASVAVLPEASRHVLESYAAGVNARISRIRQGRVKAPILLGGSIEEVEPWKPADSLAVVKLLSWCMGGTLETTLVLDDLIQRLDSVPARPFFPGRSSVDFGIAPDLREEAEAPLATQPVTEGGAAAGSTRALCRGIGLPTGGAWVLGSAVSESRAPIIVADWDLEPGVPSLFYEAQLEAGELDVAGVTIPGSPIFWAGRNRDFAWAAVPASAPVSDLFIETLREERRLYQNGTLWVPLEEREEILRWRDARGKLQESTLVLRSTRHGPLIDALSTAPVDVRVDGEGEERARAARAISWTGARVGDGLTSMLALLRRTKVDGVVAALSDHHEPVLAIAYADRKGGGGVQVAGWIPRRPLPTGLVPVQGRLRSFDWRERVPIENMPGERLGDGPNPWVLALDQPWPNAGGLEQLEWLWRPGGRAARLEAELARQTAKGPLDLRTAAELLDDAVSARAPAVSTAILTLARHTGPLPVEAEEIAVLLTRWDGRMSTDSAGAAAYQLVMEHLIDDLLRGPFGPELLHRYLEAPHVRPQYAIERLVLRAAKLRREGGWTDEARVSEAARASLREAWVSLSLRLGPTRERWAWGELHRVRFEPFGPVASPNALFTRALSARGDGQTLAYSRHRPGLSFDVERAGFYHVAMDLAASDRLLSSLAPGQSEHPGHVHFADGLLRWTAARLSLFPTERLVIEEENNERLLLEPAP